MLLERCATAGSILYHHAIKKVSAQVLKIVNGRWLVLYYYEPEFLFLILPEKSDE